MVKTWVANIPLGGQVLSFSVDASKIIIELISTQAPTASPTEIEELLGEGGEERRRLKTPEGIPKWEETPKIRKI